MSVDEFRSKVSAVKNDIDSGALVLEGTEMITKEVPMILVAVPESQLEVVNETKDGKK
jgi:hypothetical protein